uniref:Uncharacterized protein n=1 Tax=Romanomermis culicivorax TaxID=13658 RepID=A0A915K5A1_ROMCU
MFFRRKKSCLMDILPYYPRNFLNLPKIKNLSLGTSGINVFSNQKYGGPYNYHRASHRIGKSWGRGHPTVRYQEDRLLDKEIPVWNSLDDEVVVSSNVPFCKTLVVVTLGVNTPALALLLLNESWCRQATIQLESEVRSTVRINVICDISIHPDTILLAAIQIVLRLGRITINGSDVQTPPARNVD